MSNFWLSWYCLDGDMGKFELHSPWWISGTRTDDDASTICAAVQAEDEEAAKEVVLASYDTRPTALEWRFCEPRMSGWTPFGDRFTRKEWMKWSPP
jgi:hypothetical protein